MTALRILHVAPYYEQAWAYGGIPRLVTTITRGLARRGHAVTVCTTDVADARSRASLGAGGSHGVDVRMFRNVSNALAYHLQFFTPVGLRSYLANAAAAFDVAHLHACHNLPVVMAAAALRRAGVPYVVSPNGTARPIERRILAKRLFARTVGRRVLAGAARVAAVSRAEREQFIADGIDAARIALIPNPVDDREIDGRQPRGHAFRSAIGAGNAPIVLFLGKLTPRKGVDHLVRAFAALEHRDAVLVIAGNDMGMGTRIDSLVRRLGLARRVVRTGLLRGAHRLDALAAAQVVAYPSRDEAFGLVPLEAVLCGTPVIVCDDSGCGEVIREVGGGSVVPYGDPGALALALASMLSDQWTWRGRAVLAGRAARRLFGSDVIGSRLEALYQTIVDERETCIRKPA